MITPLIWKKPLLTIGIGALVTLSVMTWALAHRYASTTPTTPQMDAPPKKQNHEAEESDKRAAELEAFHTRFEAKKRKKVLESTSSDPKYKSNLLGLTEEKVMATPGLGDAEKREMWKRIQASQAAVRQEDSRK